MSNYIPDCHVEQPGEDVKIAEAAKLFPTEERRKAITDFITNEISREYDEVANYAETTISEVAADRAQKVLAAILKGDVEPARYLIAAGESSRYRAIGHDVGKPWASLIHGSLFETDGIQLRRKIVEAHRNLFESERIADLESIVSGLTAQINELTARLERRGGA